MAEKKEEEELLSDSFTETLDLEIIRKSECKTIRTKDCDLVVFSHGISSGAECSSINLVDLYKNKKFMCHGVVKVITNPDSGESNVIPQLRYKIHDTILRYVGGFRNEDDNYCAVMEFINGKNMEDLCMGARYFQKHNRFRIMNNLLNGLEALHQNKIVHLDIKPLNLVHKSGEIVKIVDFGKALTRDILPTSDLALKLGNRIIGTPHYTSPYAFLDSEYSCIGDIEDKNVCKDTLFNYLARCDIFSMGLVFYYFITGEHLVKGDNVYQVMRFYLEYHRSGAEYLASDVTDDPIINKLLSIMCKNVGREIVNLSTFYSEIREMMKETEEYFNGDVGKIVLKEFDDKVYARHKEDRKIAKQVQKELDELAKGEWDDCDD
jgi:serine/threonine protein kinase